MSNLNKIGNTNVQYSENLFEEENIKKNNYTSVIQLQKVGLNKNDTCYIHQYNNNYGGLKNSSGKRYNLYNFMNSDTPESYIDSKLCLADDIYQICGGNSELYDLIMKQETLEDAYFEYNNHIVNNSKCQKNKPIWHPENCPGPTSGSTKCWADRGYHVCNQNQEIYNYIDGGGKKENRYPKEMYKRYKEVTIKNK